jgi:hypothetical protein
MWLQTDENTDDCLIGYSVVATTDVPRLQKKTVANPKHVSGCKPCRILAFAPLAQCDYKKKNIRKKQVTAIATKKQLQKNTGKKNAGAKKTS